MFRGMPHWWTMELPFIATFAILLCAMKYMRFLSIFAVLGAFLLAATPARAETQAQASAQVSVAEEAPVILPTNPFYFTKELVRDVRRFFTFGKVNKAAYELKVADEKALEVRELEKISPKDSAALNKAIQNYNDDIARLKVRLESISETSADARVDKLLDTLAGQTLRHVELLGELKDNTAITQSLEEAESSVRDTVTSAAIRLDTPEKIEVRLEKALEAQQTESAIEQTKAILLDVQTRTVIAPATSSDAHARDDAEIETSSSVEGQESVPIESVLQTSRIAD